MIKNGRDSLKTQSNIYTKGHFRLALYNRGSGRLECHVLQYQGFVHSETQKKKKHLRVFIIHIYIYTVVFVYCGSNVLHVSVTSHATKHGRDQQHMCDMFHL